MSNIRYPTSTLREYEEKIRRLEEKIQDLEREKRDKDAGLFKVYNYLRDVHGLTGNEALIMAHLVKAGGKPVDRETLYYMYNPDGETENVKNLMTQYVFKIRKKVPDGWIKAHRGKGWYASEEAICNATKT